MEPKLERDWMQKARFLTQALILSGMLNIAFLSTVVYFALRDKGQVVAYEAPVKVKQQFQNEEVLHSYSQLSFADLILRLENTELLEEGYFRRDLALACLAAFHYFPVEKALGGMHLQKRVLFFHRTGEKAPVEVTIFVGLKNEHFSALVQFAKTEKWPLTTEGIFAVISRSSFPWDPTLLEALYCTLEFHSVYRLLQRYIPDIPKALVVSMLKEGPWKLFRSISDKLRLVQSYDVDIYRECLTAYCLGVSSKVASDLLWSHEREYVYKRWEDAQIIRFLELQKGHPGRAEELAKELLLSPRSDTVRQKAAEVLYAIAEESPPSVYEYDAILARFFPEKIAEASIPIPSIQVCIETPVKRPTIHIVQPGDSLWKIARKYKVSIEALKKANQLESERLRLGKELEIPNN